MKKSKFSFTEDILLPIALGLTIVIVVILLIFPETYKFLKKLTKNTVGSLLGLGSCPNCGMSWYKNPSGTISYITKSETGENVINKIRICNKCLSKDEELFENTIIRNLNKINKLGGDEEYQIRLTVQEYKKKMYGLAEYFDN